MSFAIIVLVGVLGFAFLAKTAKSFSYRNDLLPYAPLIVIGSFVLNLLYLLFFSGLGLTVLTSGEHLNRLLEGWAFFVLLLCFAVLRPHLDLPGNKPESR